MNLRLTARFTARGLNVLPVLPLYESISVWNFVVKKFDFDTLQFHSYSQKSR